MAYRVKDLFWSGIDEVIPIQTINTQMMLKQLIQNTHLR